jgi:hypothetical protein
MVAQAVVVGKYGSFGTDVVVPSLDPDGDLEQPTIQSAEAAAAPVSKVRRVSKGS